MSLQKLENYSNKAVVQEEVLILTELLEDITKICLPQRLLKIMELKELSTQEDYQGLNQLVTSLSNDEMKAYISRYFSILPLLD